MAHSRPHEVVLVADSRAATLFENRGIRIEPRLHEIRSLEAPENPPLREQGADRPGRVHESASARRSAIEPTDWRAIAEQQFAGEAAAALLELHRERAVESLILVAPPRFLARLREALAKDLSAVPTVSVDRDLTRLDAGELQRRLGEVLGAA